MPIILTRGMDGSDRSEKGSEDSERNGGVRKRIGRGFGEKEV